MLSNFQAARSLGWTSFAVAAVELVATGWLEDQIGVSKQHALIRAFGVREIAAGAMILAEPGITTKLSAGLWSRVAGDIIDLAAIGIASKSTRNPSGVAVITAIVLAVTGLDVLVAARVQADLHQAGVASASAKQRVQLRRAIPVDASTSTSIS